MGASPQTLQTNPKLLLAATINKLEDNKIVFLLRSLLDVYSRNRDVINKYPDICSGAKNPLRTVLVYAPALN